MPIESCALSAQRRVLDASVLFKHGDEERMLTKTLAVVHEIFLEVTIDDSASVGALVGSGKGGIDLVGPFGSLIGASRRCIVYAH